MNEQVNDLVKHLTNNSLIYKNICLTEQVNDLVTHLANDSRIHLLKACLSEQVNYLENHLANLLIYTKLRPGLYF